MDVFLSVLVAIGGVIALALLAAVLCLSIDRVTTRPPRSPKEMDAIRKQHRERLVSPHWSDLERHFGVSIPDVLCKFYDDHDRLLKTDFYAVPPNRPEQAEYWFIQQFEPADLETRRIGFPLVGREEDASVAKKRFGFASDGCGNSYFIELCPHSAVELPVFHYDHDGGSIDHVANSLAEFISWERRHEA